MWCRNCQRDFRIKPAESAMVVRCPVCQSELEATARHSEAVRHAQEILDRWRSSDLFERITSTGPLAAGRAGDRAPLVNVSLSPRHVPGNTSSVQSELTESLDAAPRRQLTDRNDHFPPETEAGAPAAVPDQALMSIDPVSASEEPSGSHSIGSHSIGTHIPHPKRSSPGATQEVFPQAALPRPTAESLIEQLVAPVLAAAAPPLEISTTERMHSKHTSPPVGGPLAQKPTKPPVVESAEQRQMQLAFATDAVTNLDDEIPPESKSDQDMRRRGNPPVATPTAEITAEIPQSIQTESSLPAAITAKELPKSAETAILVKPSEAKQSKHTDRNTLARSPLHRRSQLERKITGLSAGTSTVNRKLRVDQPGVNAAPGSRTQESAPSSVAPDTKLVSNSPSTGRRIRIDEPASMEQMTGTDGRRSRTQSLPRTRYVDEAHEQQLRGPHFEVSTPGRSNLTTMTGQFLAYLGVLGLTIGTAIVIYGHFGGYSEYTPTGWLVTTVAQMLLFLGVINLVSGGIEQNNDDVSRRINSLGEQLLRIEQVTAEVLRGPRISPRLYEDPESAADLAESDASKVDKV